MNKLNLYKYYNLDSPILINGESGTGKSCIANEIYSKSSINKTKFLTMHLASIKEELFESELFGHRKGAFTGAIENKIGYLEAIGDGTLFMDEIGELSLEAQKKLLYLLEEKVFVPVGGTSTKIFKGRLIFATNKNLAELVKMGTFREDLYYRLLIFQLTIPPLRDNILKLRKKINHFFNLFKNKYQKNTAELTIELEEFLEGYNWPGNIRELKNCLESIVAMSESIQIGVECLPLWITEKNNEENIKKMNGNSYYSQAMEQYEEYYLRQMLLKYGGRVNETARQIQISKVNLINKAKKYQINTLKMRVNDSLKMHKIAA